MRDATRQLSHHLRGITAEQPFTLRIGVGHPTVTIDYHEPLAHSVGDVGEKAFVLIQPILRLREQAPMLAQLAQ